MEQDLPIQIFTDGGARGNPGPAAIGVVGKQDAKTIFSHGECIGETTNNQAEYQAVVRALDIAKEKGYTTIDFFLDSLLVVEQLNQRYKIKDKGLQKQFVEVWNRKQDFKKITFTHIPREQNSEADAMVNAALDDVVESSTI